ncbi:MAG: sensor histidine kinase [Acidimicrobiales bacterium]
MTRFRSRYARWAEQAPAVMAMPRAPLLAGTGLAALALIEAVTRIAVTSMDAQSALVVALLALGTTLPLAVLGPAGAAMTACGLTVLSLASDQTLTIGGFAALLITLYRLGSRSAHKMAVQLMAVGLSTPFLVLAFMDSHPTQSEAAALTLMLAVLAPAAALGGLAAHLRHEARENQAARELITETLTEHTARGERARIARELHDIVAHHISMVAVQAESARLTVPGLPPAAARRLLTIGDTARAALAEMRQLLGVLRDDTQVAATDRRPQPRLGLVPELIDEARDASGSATRLVLRGTPIPVDPNVELVTYRIVQESLTNARRHAPGAAVDVELTYTDHALRLRVRDNGPGPNPTPKTVGHGVAGMRDRAAAVGGHLRTGPAPGGGFLVEAVLPAKIEDNQ